MAGEAKMATVIEAKNESAKFFFISTEISDWGVLSLYR